MKRTILILFVSLLTTSIFADNDKLRVAVFDPTSSGTSIDEGTKVAVREIISSTIVNAGKYEIVERSLLEKVMQEQSFSNSGAVDDSDATEIGKLAGANKIILSVITLTGGRNMLSVKMIDVKTASVEQQKVKVVSSGELLDVVEPITLSLIGDSGYEKDNIVISPSSLSIVSSEPIQKNNNAEQRPNKDEIVFYLPEGYKPKKESHKDLPIMVYLDKRKKTALLGSGTIGSGFTIRIPKPDNLVHKLYIGRQSAIIVDFSKYNYFELQIYRWNYLGTAMYGVSLKEPLLIK